MRAHSAFVALVMAALLCPRPARADECLDASEQGQLSKKDGKYRHAREQFRVCAQSSCPDVVVKDCVGWLEELDAKQPSISVEAKDATGQETSAVVVYVDGVKLADRLEGRAFDVDPGEHLLAFESADKKRIEKRIVLRESEKSRSIVIDFSTLAPSKPATKPPVQRSVTTTSDGGSTGATWWLAGAGVVAMGVGSYFLIAGRSDEKELADSCSPHCAHDDVDAVRNKYRIGGVTLGIGAVVVTAAVIIGLTSSSPSRSGRLQRFGFAF